MKTATKKMTNEDRRTAILRAVRKVFVEKGFDRTTIRDLADAAGVSEALLFKHFPNKECLYEAIQKSFFDEERQKVAERLEALEPSTASLIILVRELMSIAVGSPSDEEGRLFFRLILRSLMDEGGFTRLAIQGGPTHWVRKVQSCLEAARAAGDMVEWLISRDTSAWLTHYLVSGVMLHMLPAEPVLDHGVSRDDLALQALWFCLRGMGLKDEAIWRCIGAERP